jgi:hypothetical protein
MVEIELLRAALAEPEVKPAGGRDAAAIKIEFPDHTR